MQILVLIIAPIGDTLFATPSLKALRNGYPEANIEVVAMSGNKQILTRNKNIDKLIIINNKIEMFSTIVSLREKIYDLVIGLSNTGSYLTSLFKGKQKTGYRGKDLSWIYEGYVPPDNRSIHAVDYNLAIVSAIGGIADDNPEMEIPLAFSDCKFLESVNLKDDIPLIAIHPGGKFFKYKRWSMSKYRSLIKKIDKNIEVNIIILGGQDEEKLADKLISKDYKYNNTPLNMAGLLSIKETAVLLDRSNVFIGNDSAPQHIAAAMNTYVVSIFGPTNPANFHPYGTKYKIVRQERECSPCFHWLGNFKQYFPECRPQLGSKYSVPCMEDIKVDDVMQILESLQFNLMQVI